MFKNLREEIIRIHLIRTNDQATEKMKKIFNEARK